MTASYAATALLSTVGFVAAVWLVWLVGHGTGHALTRHLERADRYDDVDQREQRVLAAWRRVGMGGRR